ncbi:phytanoyl-CoA dioxygenase family protein [Sphingobacterium sp. SRCM116780]|uniref:phytanoyl-CoA dioxygenase family protein n=1 Tax=Sphingobacterium sp. SRCM116780 TaxID=2907623 RepID=UPI001F288F41|nr:phytanoyl-CoA dioxygenase family protein [Sphingobacterium sp. SRCM116780]UIR57404.1 phytanoyl-CoA dioxygenase family protein [Sphingobacterium sp. SRCM116780]
MDELLNHKKNSAELGFSVINSIFSKDEITNMITAIDNANSSKDTFRKSADLFAIRQVLQEVPALYDLVFTDKLKTLIDQLFGEQYFLVKSIYFDKPETSNWYVAYHQDLTISVDKKMDVPGFRLWTKKQNQFAVQPPIAILENNFTIRIHLDQTNEQNGALKVIEGSHLKGVNRLETIDFAKEKETICCVEAGGIMIMKPLILHGSNRTTNNQRRRVIHLEFSNSELPNGLHWSERIN